MLSLNKRESLNFSIASERIKERPLTPMRFRFSFNQESHFTRKDITLVFGASVPEMKLKGYGEGVA